MDGDPRAGDVGLSRGFRSTLFNIEAGEGPAVGLALLQSLFIGLPRLFTLTVGGAIFLDRFSADNLPYVYIAASVVLPMVGLLHLHFGRRVSFVKLQLGTLVMLSVMTAGFILLLRSSDAAWPALVLFIWCGADFHLSNIVLWSTANRIFTVREGKRLFGLIGTGEIIAAIIGGAMTPWLTTVIGTSDLLAISLIGYLLAFLNLLAMTRICRRRLARDKAEKVADSSRRRGSFSALFKSRYLALIFMVYALVLSAGFFVNNIFYFQLGEAFSSAAALAGFLGQFFAVYAFSSLIFRTFLSGRLLLRVGVLGGLLSTPLVVLLGACLVVAGGIAGAAASVIFWFVVGMRYLERLFMGSLGQPAYYTLYQPLSRERRSSVQTTAETICGPLAGGVTGAVLLLLTKGMGFGSIGLSAAVLPVLVVWAAVCVAAASGYKDALTSALTRRGISGSDLTVGDPTSLAILERGLHSSRAAEALYCLRLLEDAEHPRLNELLLEVLDRDEPEVRRAAYASLERRPDPGLQVTLGDRLAAETDGAVRGALLRAVAAAGGQQSEGLVAGSIDDPDDDVRCGALVAMARRCGAEARERATAELEKLARSAEVHERVVAARVLGETGGRLGGASLEKLVVDDDPEVCRVALASARTVDDPVIWRAAVATLGDPGTRGESLRALVDAGGQAHAALQEAYAAPGTPNAVRTLILQILGRSRNVEAARFLFGTLDERDRGILSVALWSLHKCGFSASGADRKRVDAALQLETRHGEWIIAARRDLASEPGAEMLDAALAQELEQSRKRMLLMLSFIYDSETLMKIWSNFSGSAALRDLAIELFEARVPKRHAATCLPILLGATDAPGLSVRERERQVLLSPVTWSSPWMRSCAVDAAAGVSGCLSSDEWDELRAEASEMVRETALHHRPPAGDVASSDHEGPHLALIDRVRVLKSVSIFSEIHDEVLAELAVKLQEVLVAPGEVVFSEGDLGRSMYIITVGSIQLRAGDEVVAELHDGEIFGELSALETAARSESAVALDRCHLFRLSETDLHAFMAARIEVVRGIIEVLCHRVRVAPIDKLAGREEQEKKQAAATHASVSLYGEDFLSSLEKVLILKTAQIFSDVEDHILTEVAARTQEVRLKKGEVLFHKGDPGTTTYIVAAGTIRIHVGEHWIADANERAVVGELAALSSEPRTASVTAAEDSLLLALDQESLFELMWDQHDIVRGIIHVLVDRLRRLRWAAQSAAEADEDADG